jgi:hypothetical protein
MTITEARELPIREYLIIPSPPPEPDQLACGHFISSLTEGGGYLCDDCCLYLFHTQGEI